MVCIKKKIVHDKWTILVLKMAHPHNSGLAQRIFLKFCRMKGAKRYMKILLVVFWEKKSFGAIWYFQSLGHFLLFDWGWSNWARPLLIGSLHSQDRIRILKQSRHDFSGKHSCDGFCMDIMWCLCVEVKIHGFVNLL